jgi:hypothetical protein
MGPWGHANFRVCLHVESTDLASIQWAWRLPGRLFISGHLSRTRLFKSSNVVTVKRQCPQRTAKTYWQWGSYIIPIAQLFLGTWPRTINPLLSANSRTSRPSQFSALSPTPSVPRYVQKEILSCCGSRLLGKQVIWWVSEVGQVRLHAMPVAIILETVCRRS